MEREEIYSEYLQNPAGSLRQIEFDPNNPKMICGVPLGGIGTGKIEICPDGAFRHFTINNNNVFPIDEMAGTFLALCAKWNGHTATKVLQASSRVVGPGLLMERGEIHYRGLYPKCIIDYAPKELPVKVRLTAFSPIIPRLPEAFSLPLVYFIFELQNISAGKVEGAICFSWEDVNGCWGAKTTWDSFVPPTEPHFSDDRGWVEKIVISRDAEGALFAHRKRHPEVADFSYGDYSLVVDSSSPKFVYQYDPYSSSEVGKLFSQLSKNGVLPTRIRNRRGEYAAVVGSAFSLWKGESTRIVFGLSWYTPDRWGFGSGEIAGRVATPFDYAGKKMGHWYANFYRSSLDVLRRNLELVDEYLDRVKEWQDAILQSSLPTWLQEMLINQNYVLSTNMTYTKDGRFTILESPNCPCLGTLDQRFYGSPMTLLFCPDLDHRELMMYAEFSDKMFERLGKFKGQIYHDFGNNRMDFLNNYGYNWIDLNPKFVLLCWRNYLYTGNLDALKEIYYKMKEAMEREKSLDRDGDGLPEGYGNCNTFEGRFFGANSYDGGLWLAALKIMPRVARLMGEESEAKKYEELFTLARASFEEKLWNKKKGHYIMCTEQRDTRNEEELRDEDPRFLKKTENPRNDQCRDDQLAGSWYSLFLNEGPVNDPARIRTAIETMEKMLTVRVSEDGVLIRQSELVDSNWPGFSVGQFASLAIYMGYVELGLSAIKGIHDLMYERYGMIWDQPLGLPADRRPRGDRYMNSGSIWHALWALQGFFVDVREGVLGFRPNIPKEWKSGFLSPIATGAFWGTARYRELLANGFLGELELVLDSDFDVRRLLLKGGGCKEVREIEIEGPEAGEFQSIVNDEGDLVLEFEEKLHVPRYFPVKIRYHLV